MLRALNHEIEQRSNNINMAIAAKQEQRNRNQLKRQGRQILTEKHIFYRLINYLDDIDTDEENLGERKRAPNLDFTNV